MDRADNSQEESEEQALICPLLSTRPATLDASFKRMLSASVLNECMYEKCAWWNDQRQECAVLSIIGAVAE